MVGEWSDMKEGVLRGNEEALSKDEANTPEEQAASHPSPEFNLTGIE